MLLDARHHMAMLAGMLLLPACDNSCQTLCVRLAEYREECGEPVSSSELDACLDDWSSPEGSDLKVCRQYNTAEVVRREWTCEALTLFRLEP